jgi:RimJ/RimL family protein N-acetyltransferase
MRISELAVDRFDEAADAMGDTPFNVIYTHMLRRRVCRAYLAGEFPHFDALIIRHKDGRDQPNGFGANELALWQLLCGIGQWNYVTVEEGVAPRLARLMERELSLPVRLLADVYFMLTQPAPVIEHPQVRLLTSADVPMIRAYDPHLDVAELDWRMRTGAMAGAIVDGQLVADAQPYGLSTRYCEIGVDTLEPYRNRGYSTACTALTCRALQQQGIVPVWGGREDNPASLRVAAKVGFEKLGRMTYVMPVRSFGR